MTRPDRFTPEKDTAPTVWEAGWAPGPIWTVTENLAPNEIRSPDRPARSSVAIPTELSGLLPSVEVYVNYNGLRTTQRTHVVNNKSTLIFSCLAKGANNNL